MTDNAEHVRVLEKLRGAFGAFGSGPANDADTAAPTRPAEGGGK